MPTEKAQFMRGGYKAWTRTAWALAAISVAGLCAAEEGHWKRLGGTGVAAGFAGLAGQPIEDAWFSANGSRLYASLRGGGVWSSTDLGLTWHRAERADADYPAHLELGETVDGSALVVRNPYRAAVSYALGEHLYRSDDGGSEWTNLTALGGESVIGRWQSVLAISPADADVIVVGNSMGLWKSHDAGVSWGSLNGNLPNFPSARFLGTQAAGAPLLAAAPLGTLELIRTASGLTWRASSARQFGPADIPATERTAPDRTAATLPAGYAVSYRVWRDGRPISPDLTRCAPSEPCPGHAISAFAIGGQLWSGTSNGRIWGSPDGGGNWELAWSDPAAGAVTSIWADSARPSTALAVVGGRVLRSTNGGASWFDIGSGLPGSDWSLVQGHPEADSVYVGGPRGVYFARAELSRPAPVGVWVELTGDLPAGGVEDLALEPRRGRLYVALAGYGIYWMRAPQLGQALQALSSADLARRSAAPGSLLTIMGTEALRARAGGRTAPILDADEGQTQLQVPFAVEGSSLRLQLDSADASHVVDLPLERVAPAVFVVDGEPLILDAGTGALVGWNRPAKAGGNVLVMMSGLGAVDPPWSAGLPSPNSDPPRPVAQVRALLGGTPATVASAQLAPGYVGIYLVEIVIPETVPAGETRLAIAADGRLSNEIALVIGR